MRFCFLQNLGYMTKSYIKYHTDWPNKFKAIQQIMCGLSPWALSTTASNIGIFYSMIHIENERI